MKAYLSCIKISFCKNTVYKVDFFMGILNTCLQIFIYCIIWRVLYAGKESVNGITFHMVTTNFIISQGLYSAFNIDDLYIQRVLMDGTICNHLLKPINFIGKIMADNLGNILFQLIVNFIPSAIVSAIFIGMLKPASATSFIFFLVSIILGFCVFWAISLITQLTAFWIINVWSISTIKNVFLNILAGASLPLWFMPDKVLSFIKYTPFDSIYFVPIQIYLGEIKGNLIFYYFGKQLFWCIIMLIIGKIMWNIGRRRIIVQGG